VQRVSAPFLQLKRNMKPPVIGVTTNNGKLKNGSDGVMISRAYVDALIHSGGIPLLIPSGLNSEAIAALSQKLSGILLSGGGDISPETTKSGDHLKISGIDTGRDDLEFKLLDFMIKLKKPFLGICRGFQVINTYMGGSLYADIIDQLPGAIQHDRHVGHSRDFLAHEVRVDDSSKLAGILGKSPILVNSLHHQGVKEIPTTLVPVAWAPDGLVEGLEMKRYPFGLAVQWHPEELTDQPAMKNLFDSFINAASEWEISNEQ
jgi:putative glutamine amidotransferase